MERGGGGRLGAAVRENRRERKKKTADKIAVINNEMLAQAILDHALSEQAAATTMEAKERCEMPIQIVDGKVDLVLVAPHLQTLILSFKSVARIENLVGFEKLTKLCLDNNYIEEIPPMDSLPCLEWLDLSFNLIRKITGLEKLTQLRDLSLYDNKIEEVEGLSGCTSLQCLSLGRNRISSLDQIPRFRKLRGIKMLTLAENPIAYESEYRNMVLAYVSTLTYLDYALIKSDERTVAMHQYQDELRDVIEKESVLLEKEARESSSQEYRNRLDNAGILFSYILFDDLFNEDGDLERLKLLPGVKDQVEIFHGSFKSLSEEFIRVSLERFEARQKEIETFNVLVRTMRKHDDFDSTRLIEQYETTKESRTSVLTSEKDGPLFAEIHAVVKELQEELENTCNGLMDIEIRQVEKFEAAIDDFENRINEFKGEALQSLQAFFRAVEELEVRFTAGVKGVATDLIDRKAREELPDGFLEYEAESLVMDKDTCMAVIASCNDMHTSRISKREDEARNAEHKKTEALLNTLRSEEHQRNRERILQIHEFSVSGKKILHSLLANEDEDGYEDELHHHMMSPQFNINGK